MEVPCPRQTGSMHIALEHGAAAYFPHRFAPIWVSTDFRVQTSKLTRVRANPPKFASITHQDNSVGGDAFKVTRSGSGESAFQEDETKSDTRS